MVIQWLWRLIAHPKDAGSIPAAAVAFSVDAKSRVCCAFSVHVKEVRVTKIPGALHYGVPLIHIVSKTR